MVENEWLPNLLSPFTTLIVHALGYGPQERFLANLLSLSRHEQLHPPLVLLYLLPFLFEFQFYRC